jgi:hypothetical protein
MTCVLDTRRELLAMHVAVSSLSPVSIHTYQFEKQKHKKFNRTFNYSKYAGLKKLMEKAFIHMCYECNNTY